LVRVLEVLSVLSVLSVLGSMKIYPALDVCAPSSDLVLAMVDDFSPSALEERDTAMRLFFASSDARDAACAALRASGFETAVLDVSDEDWARRSQENLQPVTVGRITVSPYQSAISNSQSAILIVITPSMGFGTGHHATTRLCLEALQHLDVTGRSVLDVGTGSGILAIAADRLGAATVVGIDVDPDAIQAARENLQWNPDVRHAAFEIADLSVEPLPPADIVTANLTATQLVKSAAALSRAVRRGGSLVVSGILVEERDAVAAAFADNAIAWEKREDEWIALVLNRP
jgi:ribosomal protein L11 methyltransferase